MKNKLIILILVILAGLAAAIGGYFFGYDIGFESAVNQDNIQGSNQDVVPDVVPAPVAFTSDVVVVDYPLQNVTVQSPLTVTGRAVGNWFFEASFPIEVVALDGTVLGRNFVQAQDEWMTTDFVPFVGQIIFDSQGYSSGFIIFHKDNPSGLPEHDASRKMPVNF